MIEFVFERQEIRILQIVLAFLFLIIMIIYVLRKRKESKKMSDFKDVLFTHISPVMLHYFVACRFTDKTILFVLLGLTSKDFYNIYKDPYNGYMLRWNKEDMFDLSKYDLEEYEEEFVKILNPILLEASKEKKEIPIRKLKGKFQMSIRFYEAMKEVFSKLKLQISEEYGLLEKRKNIQFTIITILFYYILMFPSIQIENLLLCASYVILGVMIVLFLNHHLSSWIRVIFVWFVYYLFAYFLMPLCSNIFVSCDLVTLCFLFNPLLLLTICLIGTTNFTDPKQQELFKFIISLKAQIKEQFRKKEIPMDATKQYYIKALALNISDISFEDLNEEQLDIISGIRETEKAFIKISKLFGKK